MANNGVNLFQAFLIYTQLKEDKPVSGLSQNDVCTFSFTTKKVLFVKLTKTLLQYRRWNNIFPTVHFSFNLTHLNIKCDV